MNDNQMKKRAVEIVRNLPMNNNHRAIFYYKLSLLFFWLSLMALFGILALMFWPYKTLTFEQPVKVLTPIVKAGTPVTLEIHYCKYTNMTATVGTKIVNEVVTTLPDMTVNNPPGCRIMKSQILIPFYMDPGIHYIERKIIYRPNPVREIMVSYRTENFVVIR